jgi:hypothetical protein
VWWNQATPIRLRPISVWTLLRWLLNISVQPRKTFLDTSWGVVFEKLLTTILRSFLATYTITILHWLSIYTSTKYSLLQTLKISTWTSIFRHTFWC